jgi:hypothetical protein
MLLRDPRVDPSIWNNCCIQTASEKGHVEVVKLLLEDKRVNQFANFNYAYTAAKRKCITSDLPELKQKYANIVTLLSS